MATKEIPGPNCKYLIQIPPGHDLPATLSPAAVRLACSVPKMLTRLIFLYRRGESGAVAIGLMDLLVNYADFKP